MPFLNMTGDQNQEFICIGMSESLITALSKVPQLFVIARDSTLSYKGKTAKVTQVSEELGVQYVLEGSILRAGDRLRITAQLIDAVKGQHLWAERYDREPKDLFGILDDITKNIPQRCINFEFFTSFDHAAFCNTSRKCSRSFRTASLALSVRVSWLEAW